MNPGKPFLILVTGIPATGKTTLAKRISSDFKWPFLMADRYKEIISDRLVGREDPVMFDKIAKSSYDVFFYSIEEIVRAGNSCIAEAFFIAKFSDEKISEIQKKYGCYLLQIHLKGDFEKVAKRYLERHSRGERHVCHLPDMTKVVDSERIAQSKLTCCDETIEIDTTDILSTDQENIIKTVKNCILSYERNS